MKRRSLISALGLAALLLSGCAQGQAQVEYIGAEAAKTAALTAAGLAASQVEFSGTDMSTRNGLDYYQVGFTAGGETYLYDVDALTGVIIDSQVPQGASASSGSGDPAQEGGLVTDADTFGSAPSGTPISAPAQTLPATNQAGGGSQMLTEEEAKAKALAHAGLTADQVTFIKSGLDWDDGRQTYDVEFYTQDHKEYDYNIDPYTGEILTFDFDAEYYAPPAASAPSNPSASGSAGGGSGAITAEQAKALALAQVPGAAESDIREFETDYDDGRLEYEGKIYYDHMEYEFEIDGYSGAIRSWEVESIYD